MWVISSSFVLIGVGLFSLSQKNRERERTKKKVDPNCLIAQCNEFYTLIDEQVVGLGMENTKFSAKAKFSK